MATASSPSSTATGPTAGDTVPDEDHGADMPMSMTASMILTNLPKDSTQALAEVDSLDDRKGNKEKTYSFLGGEGFHAGCYVTL